MSERDIILRDPRVIFLDGTISTALIREEMVQGDPPSIKMTMILPAFMQRHAKIKPAEMKFEENAPMKGDGYITRTYKASCKCTLSTNPEFPIVLMACNFNGDPINLNSPDLQIVMDLINGRNTAYAIIASLKKSMTQLEQELEEMMSTSQRQMERKKSATGMNELKDMIIGMGKDRMMERKQ